MRRLLPALLALGLAFAASGCASLAGSATPPVTGGQDGRLEVVTTTTLFADLVQQVGGEWIHVSSLVPRNGDVHTFSPRPADLFAVARARVIVMNGLGLDDWLDKIVRNVSSNGAPVVRLGVGLPGVTLLPGETPNTQNPHLWLDVGYAELYLERIANALSDAAPSRADAFAANAAAYRQRLEALDAWIREAMATVPASNRRIVTYHDAFPYYARAYGLSIVGVAVEAPGQDPSAGYTAQLVDAIRAAKVKAIFSEKQFPTKLADALAAQTGASVVSTLYDDALGDPPITSYEAVMRWDTQQIVRALGGQA